jgi:sterol desaturase/sphingolipid hydroxylase (fatty acid hydroxylase superfamily)
MSPTLATTVIGLAVLSAIFFVVERVIGRARGPIVRAGWWTDVAYWFFTPLVVKAVSRLVVALPFLVLVGFGVASVEGLRAREYAGFGPIGRQPVWLQVIEVYLLADFVSYWVHRRFHGGRWWPFHAVHHSSEDLDWLSSVRVHPVNSLVTNLVQAAPLALLGFNPFATLSAAPFFTFYALLLHARVNWTYGPVGRVIASPAFHRWHHSKDPAAVDRNFAGLFAFWDLLFGPFYLPKDRVPQDFGIREPMPAGLAGQLWRPFVRGKPSGTP